MTQEWLASMLQISPSTIGNWENARSEPDIHCLYTLSTLFGRSMEELLGKNS